MEILVSTGSLPWLPLDERFRLAREAGADGVELLLTPGLVHRDPARITTTSQREGVPIRVVHAVLRLRSPSGERLKEDLVVSARFAEKLPDCRVLVIHPPRHTSLRHWIEGIRTMARHSTGRVTLALETPGQHHPADRPVPFDSLEYFLRFAEEWQVGIAFDTAHAASLGWDLLAALRAGFPKLAVIHLSDATADDWRVGLLNGLLRDHRLPGSGVLPLGASLQLLTKLGFHGFVTLEFSPFALFSLRKRSLERRLADAIRFVRQAGESPAPHRHHSARGY